MSTTTAAISVSPQQAIDLLALQYSRARERVAEIVTELEAEVRAAHRKHRKALNQALAVADVAQAQLREEIGNNKGLFQNPRTWALHGIKVGLGKGRGKATWDDDEELIKRMRKVLGDESANLIRVTEEPIVDALKELDGKILAKLGVTIETTGDCVIVKAVETDTDKLVKRLLKEGAREDAAAGE